MFESPLRHHIYVVSRIRTESRSGQKGVIGTKTGKSWSIIDQSVLSAVSPQWFNPPCRSGVDTLRNAWVAVSEPPGSLQQPCRIAGTLGPHVLTCKPRFLGQFRHYSTPCAQSSGLRPRLDRRGHEQRTRHRRYTGAPQLAGAVNNITQRFRPLDD